MTDPDPLQKAIEVFWDTVPPVWNQVRGNARGIAMKDFNITLVQFHILRHIRRGTDSVSGLAELQQISRPAMSQAVDLLVQNGYITRCQDSEDRRYIHLELTKKSKVLLESIFTRNRQWMAEKMEKLNTEELQIIIEAFSSLHTAFLSQTD